MKNDQYFWNFLATLLFGILVVFVGAYLLQEGKYPSEISLFDLSLLVLATFRLTRLFVYDKVMQFARAPFLDMVRANSESGEPTITLVKPKRGVRRTIADLLSCPWCFGVWASLVVVGAYYATPLAWFPILLLAVAGLATFVQLMANAVGWKAEYLKQETEKK